MKKTFSVAVVGATGLVGGTLLSLLAERHFPLKSLFLVASKQSVGKSLNFAGKDYPIYDLAEFDFSQVDFAFFSISSALTAEYAPRAVAQGCVVIDKSSYFRNQVDVPLVIPEVNLNHLANYRDRRIIASPNCNTIPIAVGVKTIYDAVGITRMNVATYQSVSGTGKDAVLELKEQTRRYLSDEPIESKVYPQQIAFNVLPHIDDFDLNGYTREEMKIIWEMRKIFDNPNLAINPTAVRVPVICGHAAAVHIETRDKLTAEQAKSLLAKAPGVKLVNGAFPYPTPVNDAAGRDAVYVGRIREDLSHEKGLNLWIVADNLRKGAALNSIQIAEQLMERH